jgi:hypothetical protein
MIVAGRGDLAVFPCNAAKKPLMKKWQKNAQRIAPPRHWPLVGVPTGALCEIGYEAPKELVIDAIKIMCCGASRRLVLARFGGCAIKRQQQQQVR